RHQSKRTTQTTLFESTGNLDKKGLFTANALLNINNNTTKVLIINANSRQFTLSKNTKLGRISNQVELTVCLTLPSTLSNSKRHDHINQSSDTLFNQSHRAYNPKSQSSITSTSRSKISITILTPYNLTQAASLLSINTMPDSTTTAQSEQMDPISQQCHRDMIKKFEFSGDESQNVMSFLNEINTIGNITQQKEHKLFLMAISRLTGSARQWYIDNTSKMTPWEKLQEEMIKRFKCTTSSVKLELRERKQHADESVTKYYDDIIRLSGEIDWEMSNSMIIDYLEQGLQKTTTKFLQIAKTVEEIRKRRQYTEPPQQPYFGKPIATIQNQKSPIKPQTPYRGRQKLLLAQQIKSDNKQQSPQQKSTQGQAFSSLTTQQFAPCWICKKINHRMLDCYWKQPTGCFKCGQPDHRIQTCPQVFG
ncbi:unnamed protein product, partial [Didymodactylos carnosus]